MATFTGQRGELYERQCEAKSSRTHVRCKRRASTGTNVCAMHGGSAPQVKQAARLRLASFVDPALDIWFKVLKPGSGHSVKLENQIAVVKDVLDRNGLKSKDEIVLTQQFDTGKFQHMTDEEIEQLVTLARKAATLKDMHGD